MAAMLAQVCENFHWSKCSMNQSHRFISPDPIRFVDNFLGPNAVGDIPGSFFVGPVFLNFLRTIVFVLLFDDLTFSEGYLLIIFFLVDSGGLHSCFGILLVKYPEVLFFVDCFSRTISTSLGLPLRWDFVINTYFCWQISFSQFFAVSIFRAKFTI